MPSVVVQVHIEPDELLRFYRGEAREVLATSEDGRSVRFPVQMLRPFVSKDGVHGRFRLDFDHTGKSRGVRRLA